MTSPNPGGSSAYKAISMEAFHAAVELVQQNIVKVGTEFNKLVDRINAFFENLRRELEEQVFIKTIFDEIFGDTAAGIADIKSALEIARTKITQLLKTAHTSVAGSVPVASLFACAFELGERVNRPLTGLYADMTGSGGIDSWRGPTKITYEKRVADQQQALVNASDKVESLATFLGDAATANMTYMSSLAERMSAILGVLTTTCIDIATASAGAVTQVVIALGHFSELIGTVLTEVGGYASSLGTRIAEVLNQILALETEKSDLTGLTADGKWPAPVTS